MKRGSETETKGMRKSQGGKDREEFRAKRLTREKEAAKCAARLAFKQV